MNRLAWVMRSLGQFQIKGKRRGRRSGPGHSRAAPRRRLFEALEDRSLLSASGGILGPSILYVDGSARGLDNGTSWASAFTRLQDALSAAADGDEIWVAAGTYKPTSGSDRHSSFHLKSGVSVYGGFAGSEAARDDRDWNANLTTLSGEIGAAGTDDNSFVVVRASGVSDATLDGFAITGGNASATQSLDTCGGGMLNTDGSSPTVANCKFIGNFARYAGAGMCNDSSSPTVENCEFLDNSAGLGGNGGGMYNLQSAPTLANVTFRGNTASRGGGIYNNASSPELTNVVWSGNVAGDGAGLFNFASSPVLTNVTFSANTATGSGGAIANSSASAPTLTNAILWGDLAVSSPEIHDGPGSATEVSYSIIEGGRSGTGNLDTEPMLRDPLGGDLHLTAGSPAIDVGTGTGAPPRDRDGLVRPQDGDNDLTAVTDIGAYEFPAPLTTSDTRLTDEDVGADGFEIHLAYNEPMDVSARPVITFTPDVSSTLAFAAGTWTDNKNYRATYDVIDANVEVAGVDIEVLDTRDEGAYATADRFSIDTKNPTVVALTLGDDLLTDADLGAEFWVEVTYDQPVVASIPPTISFSKDVSGTLSPVDRTWVDSTRYRATYTMADAGAVIPDIGISVAGAQDPNGNAQAPYSASNTFGIDTQHLFVQSISRVGDAVTTDPTVQFLVVFSQPASGVDASDFQAVGAVGAAVAGVSPSGAVSAVYTVTVDTGTGDGTLRLDLVDDDSILDAQSDPLGGPGPGNGDFTSGEPYTIDRTGPAVIGFMRSNPDPTTLARLQFTITFDESVTGVGKEDFVIVAPDLHAASIVGVAQVSGNGTSYVVTVDRGPGTGTLQLNLADDDSIRDRLGNPLGGPGQGNGYVAGPRYTIEPGDPLRAASVGLFDPRSSTFHLRDGIGDASGEHAFGYGPPGAGWTVLVGDWDGNGATDLGLYDPETSIFHLTDDNAGGPAAYCFGFGAPGAGWVPLVGDWNGDGRAGVGLYDPSTSTFYLTNSFQAGYAEHMFAYGVPNSGWKPLVGDWNGDGRVSVGLYNPIASTFYLTDALVSGYAHYTFGFGEPDSGWQPLVGDWDGDGVTGVGLFDPRASTFYLTNAFASGYAQYVFGYGEPGAGWKPLVADWDGDGSDGLGLYAPESSTFYLTNTLSTGIAEFMIGFGEPRTGWEPLVGCWAPPSSKATALAKRDLDLAVDLALQGL